MKHAYRTLGALLLCLSPVWAADIYDGALGTSPVTQGKLAYASSDAGVYFTSTTKTVLNTTTSVLAGFSNHSPFGVPVGSFPTLDRTAGFRIRIENLKISSESHTSTDRAGFCLIALGSDKRGIELDFWQDRVFAQNDAPLFTQGESVAHAMDQVNSYDLFVLGNAYTLALADGPALLSGTVRDYSAWPNPTPPLADPYELSSYFFVGDNSSQGGAMAEFSAIRVMTVPEPGFMGVVGAATLTALGRRRRPSRPIA